MNTSICKYYEPCPVFNGILHSKAMTVKCYKRQYCEAGNTGWETCKRFQVNEITGICPPDLLPNSLKPLEDIIADMN